MKAVVIVLFALIAIASAQSYVKVGMYGPSDMCTGSQLGGYSYMLVGQCVTLGVESTIVWVNTTTNLITLWNCMNTNCNASGCVEYTLQPNTCYVEQDANNNTVGHEEYTLNASPNTDFNMIPVDALLTIMYASSGCNTSFVYAHIEYAGVLCAPQASVHANLMCSGGCLTVQSGCAQNPDTYSCLNCANAPVPVSVGCIPAFNSYVSCGPYGVQTCNSTSSTTTTGTSGSMTTSGTSGMSTTSGHATTTTGHATTTGHGTTTGGTTGAPATTGDAASLAISGLVAIVAIVAVLL